MATYKYQQNLYDGASEGYVKYNITPEPGTYVSPGERVTISGQAYRRDAAIYGVIADLHVGDLWEDGDNYRWVTAGQKAVKISKGKTGTFSLSFTLTEEMAGILGDRFGRAFDALLTFALADDSALSGGAETVSAAAQKVSVLKSRVAPVIASAAFSDATDAADVFGDFVQSQSRLVMTMQAETDPLDSAVTVASRTLTLGDVAYDLASDAAEIGAVDRSGELSWTLTVTDSKGLSSETSGTIRLLPYAPPVITALTAQRYRETVADDGTVGYIADEEGERVWFSLSGSVTPVQGKNAWTLSVEWNGSSNIVRTGADGAAIELISDRDAVTDDVPASERVEFAWTLEDHFTSVTLRAAVDKSGAYFNVETVGVAVGMRTTGTEDARKFEVAENYESHFYGGIAGVTNYSEAEVLTGGRWIDGKPIYRRVFTVSAADASFTTANEPAVENIDRVIGVGGAGILAGTNSYVSIPYVYFNSSSSITNYLFVYVQEGAVKMKGSKGFEAWVILEYTKRE